MSQDYYYLDLEFLIPLHVEQYEKSKKNNQQKFIQTAFLLLLVQRNSVPYLHIYF